MGPALRITMSNKVKKDELRVGHDEMTIGMNSSRNTTYVSTSVLEGLALSSTYLWRK